MAAITLESARGVDKFVDLFNTTRELFMYDTAIDQIFASNPMIGDKAVSPVFAKIWQNKKNITGGLGLTQTNLDRLPDGGPMNPYGQYLMTESRATSKQKLDSMAYFVFPIKMYSADQIMNRGVSKAVDIIKTQISATMIKAAQVMAWSWYGNGTQYFNVETNAVEDFDYVTDYPMFAGLGFGNSAVEDTIIGDANNYADIDRSLADNLRYRAKVYDATTDLTAAGSTNFTTVDGLTQDHLYFLYDVCRVGPVHANMIVVGQRVWRRIQQIFTAKQSYDKDDTLIKLGFDNFIINGDCVVVSDPDFCRPTEITAFNTNYTYIAFQNGELPQVSAAHPLPGEGYKVTYSELAFSCQAWTKHPGMHARIHGFTV